MFKLPPLPYVHDALEPAVSAETMRLHHDKHHAKYFETANKLAAEEGIEAASLEELVAEARARKLKKLDDNASQAWNHTFFWTCMTPQRREPQGELVAAIEEAFGGLDGLRSKFLEEGEGHFASGWVWLTAGPDGALKVDSTHDGGNHLGGEGVVPLLTCDLWEHAYYVDYRNDRRKFLQAWFDALPDWGFAAHQLAAARGRGDAWRHPPAEADAPQRKRA